MQENNSERSLNLAHFDTGLAVLMSQCCQIFIEKKTNKQGEAQKSTKTPKCFVL